MRFRPLRPTRTLGAGGLALLLIAATPHDGGVRSAEGAASARDHGRQVELSAADALAAVRPTDPVERCLANPSRLCALAAALKVTAEETLAIERVDTLLAVSGTFAELGDLDRARATASLARDAAEDIGISVGTEQKLTELAGVLASLGAHEEALATAAALEDRFQRAHAFGAVALAEAGSGDIAAADRALDRIEEPLLSLKYAVEVSEALSARAIAATDLSSTLEARLAKVDHPLLRPLGYARLAALHARAGNDSKAAALEEKAADAYGYLNSNAQRARLAAALALVDLAQGDRAGFDTLAQRAAYQARLVGASYDQAQAVSDAAAAMAAGGRIDETVALAGLVEDLRAQSAFIDRLSRQQVAAEAVPAIAERVLRTAARDESPFERDRARLAVAEALARAGAVTRAIDVIAAIEDDDKQAQALAVLARRLD